MSLASLHHLSLRVLRLCPRYRFTFIFRSTPYTLFAPNNVRSSAVAVGGALMLAMTHLVCRAGSLTDDSPRPLLTRSWLRWARMHQAVRTMAVD